MLFSTTPILTGLVSAAGDPSSTRVVYAIVIALALIGCVLVGLAIWVIRRTRIDPELLGPLEQMHDRRWRKLDTVGRRRLLDDVRPEGAEPVHRVRTQPEVDSDFGRTTPPVPSFDDLEPLLAESSGDDDTGDDDTGVADTGVADTGDDDTGVADTGDDDTGDDDTGDDDAGAAHSGVFAGDHGGDPAAPADDR